MRHPRSFLDAPQAQQLMRATQPYAKARPWLATWQVVSTLLVLVGLLLLASRIGPSAWLVVLIPWVAGLFVQIFVLQHDLGHRSLFGRKRVIDALGFAFSLLTSIPFEAWRTEHNWHHNHQGRLSKRGVDQMNSPMTVEEIAQRPEEARYRIDKVSALHIFLIGAHSLLVERRVPKGFFPFRDSFKDKVHNGPQMKRGIYATLPLHLALHGLVIMTLGWWVSALVLAPALCLGAGIGGVLFWVQHNFEHTYYAEDDAWNKANVAVHGSSYLKLSWLLSWFTADIGLHHVHHLNPRIPNYTLERARRSIEPLRQVEPLEPEAIKRSFTHLFWDRQRAAARPLGA